MSSMSSVPVELALVTHIWQRKADQEFEIPGYENKDGEFALFDSELSGDPIKEGRVADFFLCHEHSKL